MADGSSAPVATGSSKCSVDSVDCCRLLTTTLLHHQHRLVAAASASVGADTGHRCLSRKEKQARIREGAVIAQRFFGEMVIYR